MNIQLIRKINLNKLINQKFAGNISAFARFIEKQPSFVYSICWTFEKNGARRISNKTAHYIENKLNLQSGYLDTELEEHGIQNNLNAMQVPPKVVTNRQKIVTDKIKIKREAPLNLLASSKKPYAEKMAIFNQRLNKVLRFLLEENYSSLENLAILLSVPKQTAMRITHNLCEKKYISKYEIDTGLARPIVVFQPTNTGIMFAMLPGEEFNEPKYISKIATKKISHTLKLQQIRLMLESQKYTNFKKIHTSPPRYTCTNNNNSVLVIYEETINTLNYYQNLFNKFNNNDNNFIFLFTLPGFSEKLVNFCKKIDGFTEIIKIMEL